ncbi:MAG TPA: DNA polymerase III subunit alpha [Trebonia sp.]
MTTPQFTHLHVASSYSLRYGTATPAALAARAADLGMPALALTDRDGLYGAFKHAQACAHAGIKPLLGADLALAGTGQRAQRVTLLAAGRAGWASICRLVSMGSVGLGAGGAGDGPAVTNEQIAEHAEGLIVLLGPHSDVGRAVAARRPDLARKALRRWHAYCEIAVEIVDHLEPDSTSRAARMTELADDEHVPAVLTNAVRYLDPADSMTAQVLDAARHLVPLGSPRLDPQGGLAYLADQAGMTEIACRVGAATSARGAAAATFGTVVSARGGSQGVAARLLGATAELARRCELDPVRDLGIGSHHMPEAVALDGGRPGREQAVLRARCEWALAERNYRSARIRAKGVSRRKAARTARDRLDRELDIIAQVGMASYFLTVADVADRIRERGIRCAIRGSGAGSFVNHLLGISAIDPLEHDLLMERFLSPVRATLPDIDLDVESARRLEAYRIIFDAYGPERTACVSMMETYRARSAIRDVAAAMSLPPDEIGAIAKAFPHIRAKHITTALDELPELRQHPLFPGGVWGGRPPGNSRVATPQLDLLFRIAGQLDGLPRHVAMHPCGVLLSDAGLLDRTAVQRSAEGFQLSQLDKDDAEIAGVIKLDVLGVRMQSAMAHTLTEIKRTTGEVIDLDAIHRDDQPTYEMIQSSRTLGCFQIESPGQRELVKKLAPRDVADLIVDISLFRPGPVNSDMITPFLRTRHGLDRPRYPHDALKDALGETGGVVIFHEQVLRIIDTMTGCGLPEADLVRRALSAPDGPERTAVWFRARARDRGYDPATVERVWEVVAAFGGFGFCKAHAAAFAIPVYQSAWLKRHYPADFYAGVLTHDPGMYPKRVIIGDARLAGIEVLPVDVNTSAGEWRVESLFGGLGAVPRVNTASRTGGPFSPGEPGGIVPPGRHAIRVSLREVKGISDAEVARIVAGQPYTSLRDFWDRAAVSRPVTENLVLVGALDSLYPRPDYPRHPTEPDSPRHPTEPDSSSRTFHDREYFTANITVKYPRSWSGQGAGAEEPAQGTGGPTRRDLLARVGVLDRGATRSAGLALEVFGNADDGMADLVPAGQLRDLDPGERVATELGILGFDVTQHVLDFYAELLAGLDVVRSDHLDCCRPGEMILVGGVKVATQTPAVRSGQRVIFATLDDAVGLVDLAFFESVQDRCAARLFGSWLLLVRGKVRRAGAGPTATSVNATECWDLPALEEIRLAGGMNAVRQALTSEPSDPFVRRRAGQHVFSNGFALSPYAETGGPGGSVKDAPRTLWHASPGSSGNPGAGGVGSIRSV